MADSRHGPIGWYSPELRAILPLDGFIIPRSLRALLRKADFEIRINCAFEDVITNCARRTETWISDEIIRSYVALHIEGHAHSVESWRDGKLAGGLYGVSIGGAFFGESMFTHFRDASKVALASLVRRLRERNFLLLDTQIMNDHMRRFGAIEIARARYLQLLQKAMTAKVTFI